MVDGKACERCGAEIPRAVGRRKYGDAEYARRRVCSRACARRGVIRAAGATARTCGCGVEFTPQDGRQVTCGAKRCQFRRQWEMRRRSARVMRKNRERNRAWAASARGVKRQNPWLWGSPMVFDRLPVCAASLTVSGPPVPLAHARALHGAVSRLLFVGGAHRSDGLPDFALAPPQRVGGPWRVIFHSDASSVLGTAWDRLPAHGDRDGRAISICGVDRTLAFGDAEAIESPRIARRGHLRGTVTTITPVLYRRTGGTRYSKVTGPYLIALLAMFARRVLGIGRNEADRMIRVEVGKIEQTSARSAIGGHWDDGRDGAHFVHFTAEMTLNAPAAWLWRCAEILGIGGRTSLGYGRVGFQLAPGDARRHPVTDG